MEATQILLAVVATVLTGLLAFVGYQVFQIFREAQKTLQKLNKVLDDVGVISNTVSKPVVSVANLFEGVKGVKKLIELFQEKSAKKEVGNENRFMMETIIEEEKSEEESAHFHTHISALQERGRRFFHRGGKPLTS